MSNMPWMTGKSKNDNLIRLDSLFNRCLNEYMKLCIAVGKEFEWSEAERLVLEVSRIYVPDKNNLDDIIRKVTTNTVYGFTDDIPF